MCVIEDLYLPKWLTEDREEMLECCKGDITVPVSTERPLAMTHPDTSGRQTEQERWKHPPTLHMECY